MNTVPKFFTESRGTENSRLNKLSQKVTYLFMIGTLELEWFKNAKFKQYITNGHFVTDLCDTKSQSIDNHVPNFTLI